MPTNFEKAELLEVEAGIILERLSFLKSEVINFSKETHQAAVGLSFKRLETLIQELPKIILAAKDLLFTSTSKEAKSLYTKILEKTSSAEEKAGQLVVSFGTLMKAPVKSESG